MFFRRKNQLRNEYDLELIQLLDKLKENWLYQKSMLERSVDPSEDAVNQTKLAEIKYFYLFKEAKKRNISIRR